MTRLLLAAALLPGSAAATAAGSEGLEVVELARGIFAHRGVNALMTAENGGAIANVGFIVGEEAVAVVDTGGSVREGRALLAAIRRHTDRPVRHVINTHVHPDHIFGNAAFADTGASFVGHANLPRSMAARGNFYIGANRDLMGDSLLADVRIVSPDVVVDQSRRLDLGGRVIDLVARPVAHTDADLTVFVPDAGVLFAGDLVFLEHLPSIDGSILGWMKVLDDLAAGPDAIVVPGHGPLGVPLAEAIAPERRYFEVLAADLRAAIAAGVPLSRAVETAGRSEKENWTLFDQFNARNATAAYAELEWE